MNGVGSPDRDRSTAVSTTPTTDALTLPSAICPRKGSSPFQYFRAIASLMMTTGGAVGPSATANSRPATSRVPIVLKYAGPTCDMLTCAVVFGPPGEDTTDVSTTHAPRVGTIPAHAADSICGSCRIRSRAEA